jgi:hypothetical protein
MSLRVSIPGALKDACSGLMYSSVPTSWPYRVDVVHSVGVCPVALDTPKSMTLGTGMPS